MTPDQMAMRLALTDLANCLPPDTRAAWLSALQSRIATTHKAATQTKDQDQREGLNAAVTALKFLHQGLCLQGTGPKVGDGL